MDTGYIGSWGADDARTWDMDSGNQISPATRRNRVRCRWCTHFYNRDSGDRISPATRRNLVRRRWRTHFVVWIVDTEYPPLRAETTRGADDARTQGLRKGRRPLCQWKKTFWHKGLLPWHGRRYWCIQKKTFVYMEEDLCVQELKASEAP